MTEETYQKRYKDGDTPWSIGKPDFNLIETVNAASIKPCKVLDIGCGTGDNSIWLAQNNFMVTGVDASDIPIAKAINEAAAAGATCRFMVVDFINNSIEGAPFEFAFDRGCFHSLNSEEQRLRFAENVADHLSKDGMWLSILGNADEKRDRPGPPQRTARDIVNSVEPYFEIISLTASHFGSNVKKPPRAWVCLMRKRNMP